MAKPKPEFEQVVFSIKVPKPLKADFCKVCSMQDRTSAQIMRDAMRAYVEIHSAPVAIAAAA